jgi:flagellar hook-associated protein 2
VINLNISNTSSSTSKGSTTNYSRITGLATGLDTDGLVKQALAADQTKIDGVKQDLQYTQWQQESYVGYIKDLKDFYDNFDILKPDNMMLSGSYTGTTAAGTLTTGVAADNYLTATTLPGAVKGNYEVQINNLADSAKSQAYLNGIGFTPANVSGLSGQSITFSVNGASKSITLGSYTGVETVDDIVSDIKSKITGTDLDGKVSVENRNGKVFISSPSDQKITLQSSTISELSGYSNKIISRSYDSTTALSDLGIANGSFKIKVGDNAEVSVNVDSTKSIDDFINDINNTYVGNNPLSTYIDVNFSDLTKKLTISTKDTGSSAKLSITGTDFSDLIKLNANSTGVDASLTIKAPGETSAVTVTKSSNNFVIDSINYNLVSAKPGDTINLNVKSDASAQVDKFKKFVDKYNTLIDKINNEINEKKNYDYKPLTDAQKEQMTTDQITQWETKAKQGILRRDTYLSDIVSQMRQAVYDTVKGAGVNITDIGITTTSNYMDGGKLTIDEKKLKNALETKGDLVQKLFTQTSTTYENKGIFQRFKDVINNAVGTDGTLIKKAGYTNTRWVSENDLSKSITQKNAKIKDMLEMMTQKQQRLYSMYATLEQNMNSLNSQSSWLSSSLGAQ